MSHFSVCVFTKSGDIKEVEALLAPFEEWREDRKYMEFVKDEEEEGGGYWHNPNAKWDYWVVGGRWSGKLPGLRNREEGILVKDFDFNALEEMYRQSLTPWDKLGEINGEVNPVLRAHFQGRYNFSEELYIKQSTTFQTYAVVTPDGEWHAAGDMGWFGFHSDTNEEGADFRDKYKEAFLDPAIENGWYMTIVDCHI